MRGFVIAGIAVSLVGCSNTLDTGRIDYRVASPINIPPAKSLQQNISACDGGTISACPEQRMSHLRLKFIPHDTGDAFNSTPTSGQEDVYSISLLHGGIGNNLLESALADPAEILILANVFEFDPSGTDGPRGFVEFPSITLASKNGSEASDDARLKVVYYSPDIEARQPYNFSNIPIVPPSTYGGRPLAIQIVILELDRIPGPIQSMLRKLADIGQSSNRAGAPLPVSNLLLELGSSIIEGQSRNDDVLFEYRMVLDPFRSGTVNPGPIFAPGRFVMRRQQERQVEMDWSNLYIGDNDARLYRRSGTGTAIVYEPIQENLYLTINITKHPAGTSTAAFGQQTLGSFNDLLEQAVEAEYRVPLETIEKQFGLIASQGRSRSWRNSVFAKWSEAKAKWSIYNELRVPTAPEFGTNNLEECAAPTGTALRNARVEWRRAEIDAENATRAFVSEYYTAWQSGRSDETADQGAQQGQVGGTKLTAEFAESDRLSIVRSVGDFMLPFLPNAEAHKPNFVGPTEFESAYVKSTSDSGLLGPLQSAIDQQAAEFSCANLFDRGLAVYKIEA